MGGLWLILLYLIIRKMGRIGWVVADFTKELNFVQFGKGCDSTKLLKFNAGFLRDLRYAVCTSFV